MNTSPPRSPITSGPAAAAPVRRVVSSRSAFVIGDRIAGVWLSAQRLGLFGMVPDAPGAPSSGAVFHPPEVLSLQQWAVLSPEIQGWWLGLQEDLPPPALQNNPATPYALMVSRWVQSALVAPFPASLSLPPMYERATPVGQALARGLQAGLFADPQASAMAARWKASPERPVWNPRGAHEVLSRTSTSHPLYCARIPVALPHLAPTSSVSNPTHSSALNPGVILITFCPGKSQAHPISGPAWDRDLELDLDALCAEGATDVVSLVTKEELAELHVPNLGVRVRARGLNWFHLPIQDGRTPDGVEDTRTQKVAPGWSIQRSPTASSNDWSIHPDQRWPGEIIWGAPEYAILSILAGQLARQGARVVIHCKGGLGRAGTVSALLLAGASYYGGYPMAVDQVVATIREARRDAIETAAQERFLARKIVPGLNPCAMQT